MAWGQRAQTQSGFSFEPDRPIRYLTAMTATGVIEEIKHLPPAEQSRVIHFALELARARQLPGGQLAELAQQLADANDPAEAGQLRDAIHRGFYGD